MPKYHLHQYLSHTVSEIRQFSVGVLLETFQFCLETRPKILQVFLQVVQFVDYHTSALLFNVGQTLKLPVETLIEVLEAF